MKVLHRPQSGAENVRIAPVVIPELEFRDVQREILGADLVERADHAALQDRPEALNGLSVDRAHDVLAFGVVNGFVGIGLIQPAIAAPLVSAKQADLLRDRLVYKGVERAGAGVLDHAGHNVAFARDGTGDNLLTAPARSKADVPLVPMAVLRLAADESFIDFDNAHELLKALVHEARADAVAHVVGGLVGAEPHYPLNLEGADTLFAGQHKVDHPKPLTKALVRVLKDRARDVRETISAALAAIRAFPLKRHGAERIDIAAIATRAANAIGPTMRNQIGRARIFVREHLLKLRDGHLLNAGHGDHSQTMRGYYAG